MKVPLLLTLALGLAFSARAQIPGVTYTADQMDQLVAPFALYPDPLVALILPAATVPGDLTLAADYLAVTGDPAGIDSQPWDPSVKALARYPDVLNWMNANLAWTETLGAVFLQQPADVMKSIQQLRAEALAAGTLVNTPQQRVDVEGDNIRIIPAQDDTIYVPSYDASVVYSPPPNYSGPYLTFGPGYPVGAWLSYQFDWDGFGLWVGPWAPGWAYRREWRQPGFDNRDWRSWRPDPRRSYEVVHNAYRPEYRLPRPDAGNRERRPVGDQPFGGIRPVGVQPVRGLQRATVSPPPPDYRGRGPDPRAPVVTAPVVVGAPTGERNRQPVNAAPAPVGPARPPPAPSLGSRDRGPTAVTPTGPAPAPAPSLGSRDRGTTSVAPTAPAPSPAQANLGARSRGTVTTAPATPPPSSPVFGGYSRGADARDSSTRGQASRAAPVQPPPVPVGRTAPPPPRSTPPPARSAPPPAAAPGHAPPAAPGVDDKNRRYPPS